MAAELELLWKGCASGTQSKRKQTETLKGFLFFTYRDDHRQIRDRRRPRTRLGRGILLHHTLLLLDRHPTSLHGIAEPPC